MWILALPKIEERLTDLRAIQVRSSFHLVPPVRERAVRPPVAALQKPELAYFGFREMRSVTRGFRFAARLICTSTSSMLRSYSKSGGNKSTGTAQEDKN